MNIIPDPLITIISMIVFIINVFIVKKYFLTPYLKLDKKRHELTAGLKEKAELMEAQAQKSIDSLEQKLREVSAETKALTDKKRKLAQDNANKLVFNTKQKAVEDIKSAREKVKKLFEAEKQKVIEKTGPLVEGMFKNILEV